MSDQPTCPKDGTTLVPGVAILQTYTGKPEWQGDCMVTMSPGGPGRVVDCLKCGVCGYSVTISPARGQRAPCPVDGNDGDAPAIPPPAGDHIGDANKMELARRIESLLANPPQICHACQKTGTMRLHDTTRTPAMWRCRYCDYMFSRETTA